MKNLTVNMPLAVPHQRPPSKYASHPYPLFKTDGYRCSINAVGAELKTVAHTIAAEGRYICTLDISLIELKSLVLTKPVYEEPIFASIEILNASLIYEAPIVNVIQIEEIIEPKISLITGVKENIVLTYIHNREDAFTPHLHLISGTFERG